MVATFVVLTILVCIGIDVLVQARRKRLLEGGKARAAMPVHSQVQALGEVLQSLPPGIFHHPGHSWAELQPTGAVRVGVDGFAQKALGRLDRVILLPSGKKVVQGEPMLALAHSGRRVLVPAPVTGTIQAANDALVSQPESLEEHPYGANWVYSVKPSRLGEEIQGLRIAEAATAWMQGEIRRFADWIGGLGTLRPMAALQDGGMPVAGNMAHLDAPCWAEFQEQFLRIAETTLPGTLDKE